MSTTITIDGNARTYKEAYDADYKAQIDSGNTKVAKAAVATGTALTGAGESIAIKSVQPAGNSGIRVSASVKDKLYTSEPGVTRDFTVGFFAYFPKADEESADRVIAELTGLHDALAFTAYQRVKDLVLGVIDWD